MLTEAIYEKIGGDEAISAVVDQFYENVMQDPRIAHFFENIDVEQLKEHQSQFLKFAFVGYGDYPKNHLRDAHAHLVANHGLNETHFTAVVENLEAALKECHVNETYSKMILVIVGSVKEDVLGL